MTKTRTLALTLVFAVFTSSAYADELSDRLRQTILGRAEQIGEFDAEELRKRGPGALDELLHLRDELAAIRPKDQARSEQIARQLPQLDALIDKVAAQRYASRSRLYWYTDLNEAMSAAREREMPILSLQMLGKLDEDFSCANSRFFRTTLYANEDISKLLRNNFVLHWHSVRPVPRVTIDFGDGRKLERTVTGNSAHYVLLPDGTVVDALPGLYGPKAFKRNLEQASEFATQLLSTSPSDRLKAIADYHAGRLAEMETRWMQDWQQVTQSSVPVKRSQADQVPPVVRPQDLQDDSVWQQIANLHRDDATLDANSKELIKSENPTAAQAGRLAVTKRVVEDPLVRLVRTLENSIAVDTVRNAYQLRRQIHEWLARDGYHPPVDLLNDRVYTELFLTPSSDPWLGLAAPDVYTALPNGGVVQSGK